MKRPNWEVLIGDTGTLDKLATKAAEERQPHPLQQVVEDILDEVLTDEEYELFLLRFGEGLAYREIARRMGYKAHRTFQVQIDNIVKKVRDALDGQEDSSHVEGDS
jgi:DNA-directed RNA polymerase specialized sigma24 family protein